MLLKKSDTSRYSSKATDSRKFKILDGVLKIGRIDMLEKDYTTSLRLHNFPGFIQYSNIFKLYDTRGTLDVLVYNYLKRLCTTDGKTNIGILVMPNYILGNIESYVWREEELGVLKNVLKQICFSLMYAYEKLGFLHNGDHLGNILLYRTDKKSLVYPNIGCSISNSNGDLELQLEGVCVVITDFEKSTVGTYGDIFTSIKTLIFLICISDKSDIMLDSDSDRLTNLQVEHAVIHREDYTTINDVIDNIKIKYVKSTVAEMKWHSTVPYSAKVKTPP
jgi:hypothetical protein